MQISIINRVMIGAALATVGFFALYFTMTTEHMVVLMNGLFAGSIAAIVVAYWKLLWNAVLGIRPYDRVRQMTLGFALCWFAFCLLIWSSIYLVSAGAPVNSTIFGLAGRYVAIIAAVLQVTAPDFGLGIFHGRDRKVLTAGLITGFLVALATILLQGNEVLALG